MLYVVYGHLLSSSEPAASPSLTPRSATSAQQMRHHRSHTSCPIFRHHPYLCTRPGCFSREDHSRRNIRGPHRPPPPGVRATGVSLNRCDRVAGGTRRRLLGVPLSTAPSGQTGYRDSSGCRSSFSVGGKPGCQR